MPLRSSLVLPIVSTLVLLGSASAQEEMGPDQIHPRSMVQLNVGIGEQTFEVNDGTQILASDDDALHLRLRGEHFFKSGIGVFINGYLGTVDDIENSGVDQDNTGLFIAAAYRATMDDDFRMSVRFGPFLQALELSGGGSEIEYSTIGVRLSAEPEFIIFQNQQGRGMSEFSAFGEISCGAGPTNFESTNPNLDEDGYAFTLSWELGVRYRLGMGLMASLSFFQQKYHIGASESFNNATVIFNGVDDDFSGFMVGVGYRF